MGAAGKRSLLLFPMDPSVSDLGAVPLVFPYGTIGRVRANRIAGKPESLIFSQNGSGVHAVPTVLYFYFAVTSECVRT